MLAAGALALLATMAVLAAAPALWQRTRDRFPGAAAPLPASLAAALLLLAFAGLGSTAALRNALIAGALLGLGLAVLLQARRRRASEDGDALAARIEALLPQTQCTQCGYSGCKPYSQAIARGEADIDQCPPGGEAGVRALAELLGRRPKPVNPANGVEKPPQVAFIREAECIGCTKCIQACPVDAIVGAPKLMHTVVAALCTGCELCLPPCPVDCIDLVAITVARPDSLSLSAG